MSLPVAEKPEFLLILVVPGLSGKNWFQGDNVKKICPLRGRMSLAVNINCQQWKCRSRSGFFFGSFWSTAKNKRGNKTTCKRWHTQVQTWSLAKRPAWSLANSARLHAAHKAAPMRAAWTLFFLKYIFFILILPLTLSAPLPRVCTLPLLVNAPLPRVCTLPMLVSAPLPRVCTLPLLGRKRERRRDVSLMI